MILGKEGKRLNMFGYIVKCIFKCLDFKGRASRKEYWSFILFLVLTYFWCLYILYVLINMLDPCKYPPENIAILFTFIIITPIIIPCIAVSVRRMHDIGKTGWYITLPVFCIILELFLMLPKGYFEKYYWYIAAFNSVVYLCYVTLFFTKRGNRGINKYGNDPLRELEIRN